MPRNRPRSFVLLDVNKILTDPSALRAPWGRPDLGEAILDRAVHTAIGTRAWPRVYPRPTFLAPTLLDLAELVVA